MKFNKILLVLLSMVMLSACTKKEENKKSFEGTYPTATITMNSGDTIKIELYPDVAENTVNNFIELSKNKFYDGLIFHRVIPGFMIQGGDPLGNGSGNPGYQIKGEFKNNGVENNLKHTKGVISMARSQHPDSAGSQFFIMVDDAPHLDGDYAAFGKVVDGLEAVERIVSVERDENDKPFEDQRIQSIDIQENDYIPKEPSKKY